jgi:riboflavin synthase
MFTGIIEEVGSVRRRDGGGLVIECHEILDGTQIGDSIAINGVDLTVRAMNGDSLTFDVMPETYRLTNLAAVAAGEPVNLERSVTGATRLSGHIVRGVVETTCTLQSLTPEGDAVIARFATDPEYLRYIVMKGPVCVDGVSLTVMARDAESFSVSLVQYTQEHTNLMSRGEGAKVNLETDIFARYVEQLLEQRAATGAE